MILQPIIAGKKLPTLTNPGTAADLLTGKQLIDADGNVLTGTMPTQGAQTITPGTTAKTIAAGRYLTGTQTIQGDADLKAANIKSGVNIFGVTGTYLGDEFECCYVDSSTRVYTTLSKLTGIVSGTFASLSADSISTIGWCSLDSISYKTNLGNTAQAGDYPLDSSKYFAGILYASKESILPTGYVSMSYAFNTMSSSAPVKGIYKIVINSNKSITIENAPDTVRFRGQPILFFYDSSKPYSYEQW